MNIPDNNCILRIACICWGILSTGNAPAQEQPDSTRVEYLDEVVVSDSRFQLKREQSGKTVVQFTAEDLERQRGRSVLDIINTASGLELSGSRGRSGEVVGVFARGGRGRQVVVLIDGVRVTDPSSFAQEYDLRLLPVSEIGSIEIIKGAASTLYGANAATAVISINTKKAQGKPLSARFQTFLGTQQPADRQRYNLGAIRNNGNISGSSGRWDYRLSFSHDYTNGMSSIATDDPETDPNSLFGAGLDLGYRFSKGGHIRVYANWRDLDSEYDEGFGLVDAPYRFISKQERLGTATRIGYKGGSLNLNAAYSWYDSENFSAFPNQFQGENLVVDFFNKLVIGENLHTVVGINYLREEAQLSPEATYTLLDPYVNLVFTGESGLNVNSGLRLNTHSEYGNTFIYSLNPSYVFKAGKYRLKAMGSYATAYITPSLTQLFGPFGANPSLEPERNTTVEGGLEIARGTGFRGSMVYFNRKEENFVFFNNSTAVFSNADDTVRAQGIEVETVWKPVSGVVVHANYTYTDRSGDIAIRIPRHKLNASFFYRLTEKISVLADYSLTGKRFDTDFSSFEEVELDAFGLLGFTLNHTFIPDKANAFIRVDNVFNADYTEVIGFTTRGRNLGVGLELKF